MYCYVYKKNDDIEIENKLRELAKKHCRYGFDKMFQKLRKIGHEWNHKRVYRVYCAMKLNLKRKPKKRLPSREKIPLVQPKKVNMSWSLDYMSDAIRHGRRFRTANVIDDCNRECLGIKVSHALPAQRVIDFLEVVACENGYPKRLRVDNGPENISRVMRNWAKRNKVELLFIQPGKPAQNAYIERFNRTYREEVLDLYLFKNVKEVQVITDDWLQDYNKSRPHQSLGNLTPCEFAPRNSSLDLY